MDPNLRRRLCLVGAVVCCCALSLGLRLYWLQVQQGQVLASAARRQQSERLPVTVPRGTIYDRNHVPLSDPQTYYGVAVFPGLVPNRPQVATVLAQALGRDEGEVAASLAGTGLPFWLDRRLNPASARAVADLQLPGVVLAPLRTRYGPDALARHLVGYINNDGGQLGLEASYDAQLRGDSANALAVDLDGRGAPLAGVGVHLVQQRGKPPYDLVTTLDARIQGAVEKVLDSLHIGRGAVVVLDPHTGEVLASASRPNLDPADPGAAAGDAPLLNRALSAYEPGSTFKVAVAAAALEEGLVDLNSPFVCKGYYDLGDYKPRCDLWTGHGHETFADAIAKSCNVAFISVGKDRLGGTRLLQWTRRLGFGQVTPLHAFGEQPGELPELDLPGKVAQLSFGQALTATPMQVAHLFSIVANGGVDQGLRLVQAVTDQAGNVVSLGPQPAPVRRFSGSTARQLQGALLRVTDPKGEGTGRAAWLPVYGAAGKTGTAQGLLDGQPTNHAWFAGYVPAEAPRYVITVFLEGGGYGGVKAAPVFRQIAEAIVKPEADGDNGAGR